MEPVGYPLRALVLFAAVGASVSCGGSERSVSTKPDGSSADPEAGPDSGAVDAGDPPSLRPAGPHSLVVHVDPTLLEWRGTAHVLLGDGSVHDVIADASGVARFVGITLPEDVTVVTNLTNPAETQAWTITDVDREEIWVPVVYRDPECGCVFRGDVTGAVLGTITHQPFLSIVADPWWRGPVVFSPGTTTYSASVWGPAAGSDVHDFVAYDAGAWFGPPASIGVLRDVVLSGGGTFEGKDIVLDHPFDQSVSVAVEDDAVFGGATRARVIFSAKGVPLPFATFADTPFPALLASPRIDAAIDFIERTVTVDAGQERFATPDLWHPAKLLGFVSTPVSSGAGSVTATFPTPAKALSPALGTLAAPAPASRPLAVSWSHDVSALAVELVVSSHTGKSGFRWTVRTSTTRGGFSFFTLPTFARVRTFPPGPHTVELTQVTSPELASALDRWTEPGQPLGPWTQSHAWTMQRGLIALP